MSTEENTNPEPEGGSKPGKSKETPDWSNGLRELYDSVVDEPLPDSFKDLLEQLDESSEDGGEEE